MDKIVYNWVSIKKICGVSLPEPKGIISALKKAGAVWSPKESGLGKDVSRKSFIATKDIRNRYGILQLLEDIGKLEEVANYITNIYYN